MLWNVLIDQQEIVGRYRTIWVNIEQVENKLLTLVGISIEHSLGDDFYKLSEIDAAGPVFLVFGARLAPQIK
jgi:hypothetical protein